MAKCRGGRVCPDMYLFICSVGDADADQGFQFASNGSVFGRKCGGASVHGDASTRLRHRFAITPTMVLDRNRVHVISVTNAVRARTSTRVFYWL